MILPQNKQTKILKVIFCIDILIGLSWLNTGAAYSQTLPPQFVRENINQFMNKPARIDAFRRGIQVMRQRPASDPTSWAFQANIHGSSSTAQPLWNQCQHRHWWFLAWHRAYMYYLERMLQRASGESRLRIPYWNYTDPTSRSLPAPFRDPNSVLFVSGRNLTLPTDEVTPSSVNTSIAMSRINFVGSDAQLGFGGGPEPVPVQFPFTDKAGSLERLPHNAIHVQVGGIMQNARTAALDPIFWLHHCNIDRLWEAWRRSGRSNPVDPIFLNATFTLYNENGVRVTHRVRDFLVNTQQLGYTYDDQPVTSVAALDQSIGDAAHRPVTLVADATNTGDMPDAGAPPSPAASNFTFSTLAETRMEIPASVLAQPLTIRIQPKLESPDTKRLLTNVLPAEEAETRYLLVLDDINFVKAPTNIYELYLNFPTADYTAMGQTQYYIGPLSFFESDVNTHHKQHPEKRSETFDITEVVHALQRDRTLNMNDLTVTIVPVGIIKKGKPTKPVNPVPLKLKGVQILAIKKPLEEGSKNKIKEKEDDY